MNGQIKHAVGKVTYTKAANGRYRVVNALGQVNILSAEDFLTLYSPVATVRSSNEYYNADIGKWAEDTAGPFEKSDADSLYPRFEITADHLDPDGDITNPVNEFAKEMHKHVNKSQKNILQPDTIANLIQSNLEHNPDGLSRTMFGRTGKREPRQ